jgi:DNA (cytosine-5)-methyltransferase 1
MKVIDLFCGAGGFSHGFQMEGFDIVLGVDNWKGCQETYEHNHPKTDFLLMDINELDPSTLPSADVVIGSPPCTNFSVVNPHKDETKGFVLVDKFLEIVESYEPKYWIMENVSNPKLLEHLNGFPKMLVYCSDFGLRQRRRRLFTGKFPQPMSMGIRPRNNAYPTVRPRLDGRVKPGRKEFDDWEKMGVVFPSVPAHPRKGQGDFSWQHEIWEKYGIDVKEASPELFAWIQHFPEEFKFFGPKTNLELMIGNAVPPEMARILARAIKEDYDG